MQNTGIASFEVRDLETLAARLGEADVLVISGLWRNSLLENAERLRFIQSIGAGTDQFPRDELATRHSPGSAAGVNAAKLLLSTRWPDPGARSPAARGATTWRAPLAADDHLSLREDELAARHCSSLGSGRGRAAQLARRPTCVVALRRDASGAGGRRGACHSAPNHVEEIFALCCPLTLRPKICRRGRPRR